MDYREKYERAKKTLLAWHTMYLEMKERYEEETNKRESLENEIDELQTELDSLSLYIKEIPSQDVIKQIQDENKSLSKKFNEYKQEVRTEEENYKNKIASLERDKILLEGRILQLEDLRKELQERYKDLKEDYKRIRENDFSQKREKNT